jgi:mono/diheme cytochrome c family protein
MPGKVLNTILLLALLALAGVALAARSDTRQRNYEFLPNMVTSVPYDAYAPNENFADGKTLREPVAGTIPRGAEHLYYGPGEAEMARAGVELQNPVAKGDKAAQARGAVVYGRYCAACHGPTGKGDGMVAQRGFPPPPAFTDPKSLKRPDGEMFHTVSFGGQNMPSYAAEVTQEDRWKVISYIRSLQEQALKPATTP